MGVHVWVCLYLYVCMCLTHRVQGVEIPELLADTAAGHLHCKCSTHNTLLCGVKMNAICSAVLLYIK